MWANSQDEDFESALYRDCAVRARVARVFSNQKRHVASSGIASARPRRTCIVCFVEQSSRGNMRVLAAVVLAHAVVAARAEEDFLVEESFSQEIA